MGLVIRTFGAALLVGLAAAAGCGGKVLVEKPGGDGGGAGSSNEGGTVTVNGPMVSSSTVGPSTTTSSSNMTVTASVTTGPTLFCDDTGNCGDPESGCIGCSLSEDGGPCWPSYDACLTSDECLGYLDCVQSCAPDDEACYQKCAEVYPSGAQQYNDLVVCVICGACYNDCDGFASGCP
jgi:hypothetical protein